MKRHGLEPWQEEGLTGRENQKRQRFVLKWPCIWELAGAEERGGKVKRDGE